MYGEKEQWYLQTIETKNYIAYFTLSDRQDGLGVQNRDGGVDASLKMQKLEKISLYTKSNYLAHQANPTTVALNPIKEVHFVYKYTLCPGIPNNLSGGGKLTLDKLYFTYQNSNKAQFSPYQFNYGVNPPYNIKGYDRW